MTLKHKNLYYIGGVVRDEFLGKESFDTDYCYEGNAIDFAKNLNVVKENPDFGTVRVQYNEKQIDIASTRTESYPRKGHLPVINEIGCPLVEDMKRRDFTINAMAKRTSDGEIIDYLNGAKDIESKKLRILHNGSFIDDPTRIVRGLKFSVRFGFELEENTKNLQNEYLDNINYDMSYHRLKKELIETFSLNKQCVFEEFIRQNIFRLLGKEQPDVPFNIPIESILKEYSGEYIWLIYLSFFNLTNLPLTKKEKAILEWAEKLKNCKPNNNTPKESIIIHEMRCNYV